MIAVTPLLMLVTVAAAQPRVAASHVTTHQTTARPQRELRVTTPPTLMVRQPAVPAGICAATRTKTVVQVETPIASIGQVMYQLGSILRVGSGYGNDTDALVNTHTEETWRFGPGPVIPDRKLALRTDHISITWVLVI